MLVLIILILCLISLIILGNLRVHHTTLFNNCERSLWSAGDYSFVTYFLVQPPWKEQIVDDALE